MQLELKMRTMRQSLRKSGTLSFNPLPLNDKEETMRMRELAERKNEIRVLGIEDKVWKLHIRNEIPMQLSHIFITERSSLIIIIT